ncbi:MAG: hypothetical protein GC152_09285 [Alphaproteobacteria bacterium]|nr:hypothetical protein [Alphaproteobacteria bacterium]
MSQQAVARFGAAKVHWLIGEVVDERSWSESHVTGSGGGGGGVTVAGWGASRTRDVKISTRVENKREIFVRSSNGLETSFVCPQEGVAVRAGHRVACVYLERRGQSRALVRLHNASTGETSRAMGDGDAIMYAHPGHVLRLAAWIVSCLACAPWFTIGGSIFLAIFALPGHFQFSVRRRLAFGRLARKVTSDAIDGLSSDTVETMIEGDEDTKMIA